MTEGVTKIVFTLYVSGIEVAEIPEPDLKAIFHGIGEQVAAALSGEALHCSAAFFLGSDDSMRVDAMMGDLKGRAAYQAGRKNIPEALSPEDLARLIKRVSDYLNQGADNG